MMISGDRLPTLTGERIALRWLTRADAGALFELFSNGEVMRYWSRTPFTSEAEAVDLVTKIERAFAVQSLFQWGIALADSDRVIGTCTLAQIDPDNRRAELGYALGRRYWRQGLMHEALQILLGFAFGPLGLRRLEADVDPLNAPSIRSLERLGFVEEGLLRERWFVGGVTQDALIYGLLKREWESKGQSV
jgi:[ribosomal protein S5]-alanine N-acetyltransferase